MCVYVYTHVLYVCFFTWLLYCVCVSVCVCAEDGSEEKINEHLALCVAKGGRQYQKEKVEGIKYTVVKKV